MKQHLDRIAHIQIADNPGRHERAAGEINYPFLFQYLDETGYRGWIGCDYDPGGDLRWPWNVERHSVDV